MRHKCGFSVVKQTFELMCRRSCGLSYFDEEYPNSFLVKCHLCGWEEPNPAYKAVIEDNEILAICDARHHGIFNTPDKVLNHKYTGEQIHAKMEELDHRELIEWGVSLCTAWTSEKGTALLNRLPSI